MTPVRPLGQWYLLKPHGVNPQAGAFYLPGSTHGETAEVVGLPEPPGNLGLRVGDVVLYDRAGAKPALDPALVLVHANDIRARVTQDPEGN